ncbi:Arabinose efflux permease [Pseudomonas syringae pv. cilantro]|uniref:Arabinose efflux permease n=2 Tax=Pseudomonas syringae group TaxID=136849 RepID=A0A0N0XCK9_PSESX|nr:MULTISPECIES: MFS transporter [Pseudomonas syringae group]KPC32946.1 Arabinose efflux permease [Pseudomonas syringae pv. cilantro]KPW80083.1 Arabinose efflux permease [Pseudomonas syringae pv. coriandricola]RMN09555.1 Arabinose efflux permease [Pseudomonas syringae pv. coriandricola]
MKVRKRFTDFFISRNFSLLWLGQALSSFGEFVFEATVIVWLATDLFYGSTFLPTAIGLAIAASAIPRILVAPLAGVWVDRLTPLFVMISADVIRALNFVVFFVLYLHSDLEQMQTLAGILILLFFNSVAAQFFNPSRQAIMQIVIPSERRVEASAKAMFSLTGISVLSASVGPALFVWVGPVWAMVINVLALVCSALCIASTRGLRNRLSGKHERLPFWSGLMDGLRFSWRHASIRTLLIGIALYGFSLGVNNVALSLYAFRTLALKAEDYGLILAAFPVGGLIASLLARRVLAFFSVGQAFTFSLLCMGLSYIGYSLHPPFYLALILMLCCGLFFAVFAIVQGPMLQEAVPTGYMGRVSATITPVLSISSLTGTLVCSQTVELTQSLMNDYRPGVYGGYILIAAALLLVGGAFMLAGQRVRKHEAVAL